MRCRRRTCRDHGEQVPASAVIEALLSGLEVVVLAEVGE